MVTHYDNLKVMHNAPLEVIKASYKALAQKYHPDRNPGPNAARNMQIINDAYAVLSDPEKRAAHDQSIARQAGSARPSQPKHSGPLRSDERSTLVYRIHDLETANSAWEAAYKKLVAKNTREVQDLHSHYAKERRTLLDRVSILEANQSAGDKFLKLLGSLPQLIVLGFLLMLIITSFTGGK